MLDNINHGSPILDGMFLGNPSTGDFLTSQIDEARAMLHRIDKELADSLINNISLIQRLSAYDSLPIADRYALVPIQAVHDKDCSILRILFDDLEDLLSLTTDEKDRQTLISLRRDCFNLLSSAAQNAAMLQAGIQGNPIPDAALKTEITV